MNRFFHGMPKILTLLDRSEGELVAGISVTSPPIPIKSSTNPGENSREMPGTPRNHEVNLKLLLVPKAIELLTLSAVHSISIDFRGDGALE